MSLLENVRKGISLWRREGFGALKLAIARRAIVEQSGLDIWSAYRSEATALVNNFDFSASDVAASRLLHQQHPGPVSIKSVTWFIPDFNHAYYGGIYTILRLAAHMAKYHGVQNQFALVGSFDTSVIAAKIGEAFPELANSPVLRVGFAGGVEALAPTDAAIATLWTTAYFVLRFNKTARKFYFIQDCEPLFYPAGSTHAQVEATYRFGFYGLCNTPALKDIYEDQYQGQATFFYPCVDTNIFHAEKRRERSEGEPYRLFFYGRPGHPRNGFELGIAALRKLKRRLGKRVQILCAGDDWDAAAYGAQGVVENLGMLPYEETGDLYRSCDAGFVMMFTRHPSYLPFEMMACGCSVVTNYNPWTTWLLKDGENCLLSLPSATSLADRLEEALLDEELRLKIGKTSSQLIKSQFSNWHEQLEKVYGWMCDPDGQG